MIPMLKDLGFPEERIQVLYGGIDLKDFPYIPGILNPKKFQDLF